MILVFHPSFEAADTFGTGSHRLVAHLHNIRLAAGVAYKPATYATVMFPTHTPKCQSKTFKERAQVEKGGRRKKEKRERERESLLTWSLSFILPHVVITTC